jgi:GT2 family glycosyltransferase
MTSASPSRPLEELRPDAEVVAGFHVGEGVQEDESSPHVPLVQRGCSVAVCTFRRPRALGRFVESLASSSLTPDELIIADASPDDLTEQLLRTHPALGRAARRVRYFRLGESVRGLTRQRNFALRKVRTDLVAFFDDDIVLEPDCLARLEEVHRRLGSQVVGVGALIQDQIGSPSMLWRLMRALRMMPNLQPGRYHRSGISTPWVVTPSSDDLMAGDWLPGGATMWRTIAAREVGFNEQFEGYGQGEDLEFSLRVRARGSLYMAGSARVQHLHEPAGRSDPIRAGYMALHNRYEIHKRAWPDRTIRDVAWFVYAFSLDSLLLARNLLRPRLWGWLLGQWRGRFRAARDLLSAVRRS